MHLLKLCTCPMTLNLLGPYGIKLMQSIVYAISGNYQSESMIFIGYEALLLLVAKLPLMVSSMQWDRGLIDINCFLDTHTH